MSVLARAHALLPPLLTPLHRALPFALLDLIGAARLSSVINWAATGVFDAPGTARARDSDGTHRRATALQELVGLMLIVFGPETFLAACTGGTPGWLLDPKLPLLFAVTHIVQTRTPLRALLPAAPSLALELVLAVPDAIGRSLLLTRVTVVPLLHPSSLSPTSPLRGLPPTPASLLAVPFISAVPFAALAFTGLHLFAPAPRVDTPAELRPGGWRAADVWIAVVVPALFLVLVGPVDGWPWGASVDEDDAFVLCAAFTSAVFLGRAYWNFGRIKAAVKRKGQKSKTH
ncbi:hypothetical protein Q5752_005005 [Cryptotrichosporon argae]